MTKLKRIQDNDWVEGATFSFGSKQSAKEKATKENRSARRESMILHQTTRMTKNGKKSLAVNGFDLMKNSLISSPISHRTRRQSMAVLPKRPVSESETISPKIKKPSLSHKVYADEKPKKVDCDPVIIKKIASKSSLNAKLSLVKLPRSGSTVVKLNDDRPIKEAEQMKDKSNGNSAVKIKRNAGSTHLSLKKIDGKQKSSVMVKKPVKRLISKAVTPLKSPINNNRRLTRSAKKKVKIVAESPIFSNGNFRKTPVRLSENKQTSVSKLISNSSLVSKDFCIEKVVSVTSQKYNKATPFTPKPEEPLKLIRQNMKKKIADDIQNAKEFADPSFLAIKKTPIKYVESKAVLLPSTPVSSLNLPPTPVSSRKSILRSVRKRDSVRIETKMSSENGDCEMTSSILLEKPWSSTPLRKSTDETESPYPESNLINISELTHNSRDTDISDSFSESVVNVNSNGVDELTPEVQLETGKRSFCSLM